MSTSYSPTDSVARLIDGQYTLLPLLSRFGIPLGVGEKTIDEICRQRKIDTHTFLLAVNLVLSDQEPHGLSRVDIPTLQNYLKQSHKYFQNFLLPKIRPKIVDAIRTAKYELSKMIIGYFDQYFVEVERQLQFELKTLVPYLKKGGTDDQRPSVPPNQADIRFEEFRQIMIKYYPGESTYVIVEALTEVFGAVIDLKAHQQIVNRLLVPALWQL